MPKVKTDQDLVDEANTLARKFYKSHGYEVDEGYRFDRSRHPQELGMLNLAVIAMDFLRGDDVQNALDEVS